MFVSIVTVSCHSSNVPKASYLVSAATTPNFSAGATFSFVGLDVNLNCFEPDEILTTGEGTASGSRRKQEPIKSPKSSVISLKSLTYVSAPDDSPTNCAPWVI